VVVPLLVVVGWLVFGPRNRVARGDVWRVLAILVIWCGYTLVRGAFVDWYPYPFIDVGEHGYPQVLTTGVGVALVMVGLALLAEWLDDRLPTGEYDRSKTPGN
jgi:hypothetical protein